MECEILEGVVSSLGGGRTCVDIVVVWRPRGDGRFGWFGSQNHMHACRFFGLGLKTGSTSGEAEWRR